MFFLVNTPLNYNKYSHSHISGEITKIKKNSSSNNEYTYKLYVKLEKNSNFIIYHKNQNTKNNEIKIMKPSKWVDTYFLNSLVNNFDCIMDLSTDTYSKFVFSVVDAKITSKSKLIFYVNSSNPNNIFNLDIPVTLSFKTKLNNVNFFIFDKFNLEDNLNIINANNQFLSNDLNNIKNGQLVSITKVGTILKNSINLPDSDIPTCPEQNITVYKVLYWSSQTQQNGPQLVSGSILVPENVSKKEILQTRNGATFQYNDNSIIWYSISNGLDFNKMSIHNKSTLLFSGLGYIVVHADGFGLGANEGKVSGNSDFYCEVYPHVDIMRAVRTTLPLFSPNVSIEPLNIIYCGYSNGAVYGPSILHQLVPGNNQKIPSVEASKFSYTRMILGGCPGLNTDFFKKIKDNPTNTLMTMEGFGLLSWIIAHSNSGIMMARPSAYNEIITPIALGDELGSTNSLTLQQQLGILIVSNSIMHPSSDTDKYNSPNVIIGVGDIRQLVNIDNAILYSSEFIHTHGWTNPKIRLTNFPKIPITMIYSSVDQIVSPTLGNTEFATLKKIFKQELSENESAIVFDGAAVLDDYMGKGKVIGPITQPGANKTVTVNSELNDLTQNGVKNIASHIKNITGNNYLRIKIEPANCRGLSFQTSTFGRGSYGGSTITRMESTYYALQ
jgi:hypothetical protein